MLGSCSITKDFSWKQTMLTVTCEASEKFGPGDRFLGTGGIAFGPAPDVEPFRFRRLFAGRCVSTGRKYSCRFCI